MKDMYEMPQITVVEMEIQNGIMQDPSDTASSEEGGF